MMYDKLTAFLSGVFITTAIIVITLLLSPPNAFISPNSLFVVVSAEQKENMIEYNVMPVGGQGNIHITSFRKYMVGDTLELGK